MSIELITNLHSNTIFDLFENTESEILIISPFIGKKTSSELTKIIRDKKIKCKLITRFYREDFIQGVSSLDGLKELMAAGVEIYALKYLHTKLYIFDDYAAIITSANFTYGGLTTNYELGLKCYEEDDITQQCKLYFRDLLFTITTYAEANNNEGIVTQSIIDTEIEKVLKSINTRDKKTTNLNKTKWGADVRSKKSIDSVEEAFSKKISKNIISAGWIKFEADANHRHDANKSYFEGQETYIRDKTFFPANRKPRGIKKNQKIYLALVSYDVNGYPVPMIVGWAYSEGFKDEYVMTKGMEGWQDWMENYPNFIYLFDGKVLKAPAKYGISMNELYTNVKEKVFPTTAANSSMQIEDLRHYHYRRDKVRITNVTECTEIVFT